MDTRRPLLYLRIDVAVCDEKVQPSVVVVVEEASTETEHIVGGDGDAGLIADLDEGALSIVVPEMVRGFLEIGYVEIEPAIVVIVAKRDTHGGHRATSAG